MKEMFVNKIKIPTCFPIGDRKLIVSLPALSDAIKPLSNGKNPPPERLPEPTYVNVTHEEYEKMMSSCKFNVITEKIILKE